MTRRESRRRLAGVVTCLVCVQGLAATGIAQFRSGTSLVVVDAVVSTETGSPVLDLTASDVELLVDGRPAPVEQFRLVDVSAATPDAETPEGVASNAAEPGGVFALVIDELNLGTRGAAQARRLAVEFIQNSLLPHDYAAVLRSGSNASLLFGNDRDRLIAVAQGTMGRGGAPGPAFDLSAAVEASAYGRDSTDGLDPTEADSGGSPFDAAAGLEMVRLVVERMAAIPARRKAVLWFNEGIVIDVRAALANPTTRTGDKLRQVIRAAFEANVAIYPVDPRGLYSGANVSRFRTVPADGAELDALRDLASVTGGKAIVNTNALGAALEDVARENRAYYLLGYAPTGPLEKKWRVQSIEVRVRRPGVQVRHRTGFVPVEGRPAPALVPVARPLPFRGLHLAMAPVLVSHLSRTPSVVVPFTVLRGLPPESDATFLVMAVNEKGQILARQSGRLPAGTTPMAAAPRLALPAGRYQIRLIVQGVGTGGTVFTDVLVPKASASPPECGGLHLIDAEPNVVSASHVFGGGAALRVHATMSASGRFNEAAISTRLEGGMPPDVTAPVRIEPGSRGWWRLESSLTLPERPGRYRLTLQVEGRELAGCAAEVDVHTRTSLNR